MDPVTRRRLLADIAEMAPFEHHPTVSWTAELGDPPMKFWFKINVASYTSAPGNPLRKPWTLRVSVPAAYPVEKFTSAHVVFDGEIPFNPHVYINGQVCLGGFVVAETIWGLVHRITRLLQLDPSMVNTASAANSAAMSAYTAGRLQHPCDTTPWPELPAPNVHFAVRRRS